MYKSFSVLYKYMSLMQVLRLARPPWSLLDLDFRLQRHNIRNNGHCTLCYHAHEEIHHLRFSCSYSKGVWYRLLRRVPFHYLLDNAPNKMVARWISGRKHVHKKDHTKGFDTSVLLLSWQIWKERNTPVFDGKFL
jgi:hypothetical protein